MEYWAKAIRSAIRARGAGAIHIAQVVVVPVAASIHTAHIERAAARHRVHIA